MNSMITDGLARNFLAGNWVEGDQQAKISVEDPATLEIIADCALASEQNLDTALVDARDCFSRGDLADMLPIKRADLMRQIAHEIRALKSEGGLLLCRESGKTLIAAEDEFEEAAQYFDYYGGVADKIEGKSIPLGPHYVDFTYLEPYGVSAQIIPWNFPVSLAARSMAPALAAGNSVIVKAPELDPLALLMLGLALQRAGVPSGAVSILNGTGAELGAQLVASPLIDQIVFTGSVATGQAILRSAAENVTPSLMELGGKSAAIVYGDADIEQVVTSIKSGIFFNAGQVCSALSRLLVERSRYDELVERAISLASGLSIGPGLENPDLTPIISAGQLDAIEEMTSKTRQHGARVGCGGTRIDRLGHFMAPTILWDVAPASLVAQQEIFGPVLCITPFDRDDEAIEIANGTDFGLVAGVFTRDLDRAHLAAKKLRAGQIYVNEWYAGGISTPFGGTGKSGVRTRKRVGSALQLCPHKKRRDQTWAVRHDASPETT